MDPPSYSDPVTIPFTFTMDDPRLRRRSGRWGRGPLHHPSTRDPGWFKRQAARPNIALAQYTGPIPLYVPVPPYWPPDERGRAELDAMIQRARRRAQEATEEIQRGEYGAAAGHLLLGQPYPAEVDSPAPHILRNETQNPPDKRPSKGEIELNQKIDEAEKDFEARRAHALDERHLQTVESERGGHRIMKKRSHKTGEDCVIN